MSWDANLYRVTRLTHCGECGHELAEPRAARDEIGWWNYTHNVAGMLNLASVRLADEPTFWKRLDGMSGEQGAALLDLTIRNLEADPGRYLAMNPPNGWGDYDGILAVLREMRAAIPGDGESVWEVSG